MATTTSLELALIIRDPEIQPRERMNHETITQYSEDMLAGIAFPPIRVFFDGERYWLSQGFHRFGAAEHAGIEEVDVEIIDGTRQDAIWDAAGSNLEHDTVGLRRSNADKRRAVEMALRAKPQASDRAIGQRVGVSHQTVNNMRSAICQTLTDAPREVTRNGKTYEMQTANIGKQKDDDEPQRLAPLPDQQSLSFEEEESEPEAEAAPAAIITEIKPTPRPTFNQTNEMVDWARWTWNPVTGCEHNCVYCYARDIANRFYAEGFKPTNRPERLEAPRNTRLPGLASVSPNPIERTSWKNVFVCSMADLFGRWVPDEWIDGVFDSCRKSPEWNYLFLTKFPQRYVGLDFPETAWVGTSVDEQKRVANAEKAFRKIDVPVKWLSVEPMQEPIKFNDLSVFDWVVIGGRSRSSGAPEMFPDPDWVTSLINDARQAGCKVYCKPNTDPAGHWAGIYRQYPDAFQE
jgi:protein gp37